MDNSFISLCRIIVETNGNPTWKQVRACGYSFEAFLRMAQPNINRRKLVASAKQMLKEQSEKENKNV